MFNLGQGVGIRGCKRKRLWWDRLGAQHSQGLLVVCEEAVSRTVDVDERFALGEDVTVALAVGIVGALAAGLVALGGGAHDDDGDGRVLKTVLGHAAGEEALEASETLASGADDQDGGLVEVDLVRKGSVAGWVDMRIGDGDVGAAQYHVIDDLVDLAYGELENQVDGLVVVVATLYVPHGRLGLGAVAARLDAAIASNGILLLHDAQTHYFIAVVDELVDEPLERVDRVLVLVEATQKGARPLGVLVVLVLGDEREGALLDEVGGLVERVKGNAGLEDAVAVESAQGSGSVHVMRPSTYGGGGGLDSRLFSRGFGFPRGSELFLWARNWIDGRRGSSASRMPVGSSSGLTLYGADDLRAPAPVGVGEPLMLGGRWERAVG